MGTKGAYGGRAAAQALPLEEGCYDANYADKNGRRPGDKGFVPPKGAKWTAGRAPTCVPVFEGFDENYRDDEGRKPGDTGFVPPVYDDKYRDANGKAPGEAGFVPPKTGLKGAYNAAMKPLDEFCYDENYRDSEGRKPGDRGFIPPRYAQRAKDPAAAAEGLEEGFDECYRDTKDCAPSESGFRPPVGTGGYHKPPTSMLVDPAYTDVNGKRAGEDGFIVPSYDAEYRDANGRRAGQKGFVPPLVGTRAGAGGKTPRNPQPLGEFCYDENYVDDKGRRPGDFGFVPPLAGLSAADRAKKALGLSEGFDEHYVDANGKSQGDAGFVPPCYTADYTDAGGRRPGEQGFVPPCHGRKGTYGGTRAARAEPLGEGEYDENYRDNNGRRPGDQGFIPPLAAKTGVSAAQMAAIMPNGFDDKYRDSEGRRPGDEGFQAPHATGFPHASSGKPLEAGYDQNFQDAQGRKATDADFIQPSYTDEYRDKNGRRPGQKGFLPPRRSRAKARIVHPLDEGEYDEDYRDAEGRGAGDRGFCPPPIRGRPSKPLAAGYDDFFVDAEGRHQNDKGFVPPQGSRGAVSAVRALPQNYDPLKEEKEEKKTVGHKPRAQMTRQQALAHAPQMTAAMELEEEEEPEPPQSQLTRAQRAEVQRTGREGARDAPSRTPEPGARKADAPRAGLEGARRTGPAREMDDEEDAGARRAAPTRPKRAPRDAEDDEYAEQETRERARRKRLDDDWLDRADKAMEKAAKMAESAAAKAAERAARKAVDDVLDRVVDKSVDRAVDRAVPAAVDKAVEAALGRYDRGARAPALDDDSEAGSPTRAPGGRGSPTKGALRSTQASPEVPELGASASSRGGRQRHQTKAGRTALDGSMALDELEQSDEEEMQDAAMSPTTQTATAPQKDRHTRERLIRSSADVKDADFEAMDKDGRLPGESGYRGPAKQRAPPARRKGDLSDGEMDAEKYIMTDTAFKGPGAKLSAEAKKRALEAILDDYFASLAEQPDENGRLPGQEGYVGPARQQALMSALRKAGQLADEPAPPMIEIARVASASPTRTPQQEPHAMSARSTASVAGSEDADGKTEETPHVATELKRLQKKHKSAQKTLEKRQQQAAQTLVAELDEEEVDEISRLEEELEAEKARRIAILDENLSDALAAAPTDATKQELQQQYSSDKAAIENSIERDRAARQEQIKAKLAAKKVKKQKILDEKHDEETKLERMTQEAEEDDLKRLMMDASQNQDISKQQALLTGKLADRVKRQETKQAAEQQILMRELDEAERVEHEVLDMKFDDEYKRRKQVAERDLEAKLAQATSEEMKAKLKQEFQEDMARVDANFAATKAAQEAETRARLQKKRLEKEAELRARQNKEKEKELQDQEVEINKFEEIMKEYKKATDQRDIATSSEFQSQRTAAEEKIKQQRAKRRQQAEQARRKLDEELAKEAEASEKKLEEDKKAKLEEVEKQKQEELEQRLKEEEAKNAAPLSQEQRTEVLEQFKSEQAKYQEEVEEEIRKQREASRGRLEERRRKKEQAIQNKLASVTKADLEDNEKMLEKLEASAGPSATQTRMMALKKLLPKLRLPGDLNQSKQRLEEQYQQKQEMLQKQQQEEARRQEKKLEEETRAEAMRQEGKVKAEQAARLDALRKEQEEKAKKLQGEELKLMLTAHEQEMENLKREMDAERREQDLQLQKRIEKKKAQRKKEIEKAQEDQRHRLEAEKVEAQQQLEGGARRDAEKEAVTEAVAQGQNKAEVARALTQERHKEEQEKLEQQMKKEKEWRLQRLEEDLKARYEEAKLAIQEEAMNRGNTISKREDVDEEKKSEEKAELKQWVKHQVKYLKAVFEKEEARQREELGVQCDIEAGEARNALRVKHLNELAKLSSADSPTVKVDAPGNFTAELADYKQRIQKEQEDLRVRLDREKKQYQEDMQKQMQNEIKAYEEELAVEKKRFEEQLAADKASKALEKKSSLLKMQQQSEDDLTQHAESSEADDQEKAQILREHREAQTRLQTHVDNERELQRAEIKAKYEKKRKAKLDEKKRKAEQALKKAGDIITKAIEDKEEQREKDEHGIGALVLSRWKKHSLHNVDREGIAMKEKDKPQEKAALPISIPMGQSFEMSEDTMQQSAPSMGASFDTWAEALMRSPLFTRIQQIEDMVKQNTKMLLDMAATSKQKYRDPKDLNTPNEGRLTPVEPNELPTTQFVAYQLGRHTLDLLRRRDSTLPAINLRVASALPAWHTDSTGAFRNSFHYDAANSDLYIRNQRFENTGDLLLVLLSCLGHLKSGDLATTCDDTDPTFLRDFYGLSRAFAEELFFSKAAELTRPIQGATGQEVMAEVCKQLDEKMQGMSPAEKEACVREFLKL
uniref:Uncharacterized protein n=1 Tax=Eutreptiella gymnastica TaxID=73025 RepID=A0A7S4FTV3_9EUGL